MSVSIHALLAECDSHPVPGCPRLLCFNPRTPCGVRRMADNGVPTNSGFNPRTPCGVRRNKAFWRPDSRKFQSTHSLRSATQHNPNQKEQDNVSIHALLAECDTSWRELPAQRAVSIHALLAECDLAIVLIHNPKGLFQSTHSLRSATRTSLQASHPQKGFNPRTPCGVRR